MRIRSILLMSVLPLGITGCSPDLNPFGKLPTYEDVAGQYSGPISGSDHGDTLHATLTLSLVQAQGVLAGSYTVAGTVSDSGRKTTLNINGAIDGSVGSGSDPDVSLYLVSSACPSRSASLFGPYVSGQGRIDLSGTLVFYSSDCSSVSHSYILDFTVKR